MKRSILAALALVSACAASASAEGLEGNISIGGSYSNIKGQEAKFNEYRALGNGTQIDLGLNYRDTSYYFDLLGNLAVIEGKQGNNESITSDADVMMKLGMTDMYKLSLFYKDIPHNFTYDARTFLNGVGTYDLTKATPNALPTLATYAATPDFDYSIKRHTYGAEGEVSLKTPFFFSVNVDRNETNGLMPFALTTSLREYPVPVNYLTNNLYLQTGYRSNNLIATLDGTISTFENDADRFRAWQNFSGGSYTYTYGYLPADNKYYKVGGSVMYKLPFWGSTFMAKAAHSILESDVLLSDTSTSTVAATGVTTNSSSAYLTPRNWAGRVNYTTASASLTSNPAKDLNTRIFFNFLDKENNGPADFNYGTTSYTTELFDYNKRNMGVDASYKLPAATKLSAGYEYLNIHRAIRHDAPKTVDHTVFVQIKNELFDWMTAKVRYQRLMRDSENLAATLYGNDPVVSAGGTSLYWTKFFQPADTADKNQDAIKVGLDFEPLHGLSLGVEYAYKHDNYTQNYLGILKADRHEVYVDANYTAGIAKLNAYADIEKVESNSRYRQMPRTGTGTQYADPFGFSNATNYNWTSKRKDFNYALGIKADVELIKNTLTAGTGYRYENANGSNDFTTNVAGIAFTNVSALDDYIKHALNAKLTYNFTKAVALELGYLYEHLKYSDDAWNGYQLIPVNTNGTNSTNYLSGAYTNPSYDANVVYTKLNFKF